MTSITVLFLLIVLLLVGSVALALAVLVRREAPMRWLFLGALLAALAVVVWLVGIQNPLPLP